MIDLQIHCAKGPDLCLDCDLKTEEIMILIQQKLQAKRDNNIRITKAVTS